MRRRRHAERAARRDDLESILLIGSGPIVIGQACEFDYSGTQACRVLRRGGLPRHPRQLEPGDDHDRPRLRRRDLHRAARRRRAHRDHRAERPDAAAADARRPDRAEPGHGARGDRGARPLRRRAHRRQRRGHRHRRGPRAVQGGHDRDRPGRAGLGHRPHARRGPRRSSTRSASRSSSAPPTSSAAGARASPPTPESSRASRPSGPRRQPHLRDPHRASIAGWKEFELEVMRDRADNCVVVCSIENLDPMGVHTGDSITVAPAQTLSDVEYQRMRDAAFACIRRVGVETGGSNVQFAVNPTNGDMVVIEMNPRVSRSQRAGVEGDRLPDRQDRRPAGRRLHARRDPQRHHPRRRRPASSRPSTTWSPRCPAGRSRSSRAAAGVLGTQMQSVGEAMAIGRTFPESLQKGLRSLEQGRSG